MTGTELKTIMERLRLSGGRVASLAGFSRQRVSKLLAYGDRELPSTSQQKIVAGLILHGVEMAGVLHNDGGQAA